MSRANRERRERNRLARAATGQKPSFLAAAPLELHEIPVNAAMARRFINEANDYLRAYKLADCSVIVTREFAKWHLSIAHPERDPTWREIAEARYRLLPNDVTVAMLLPPLAAYINLHRNCYQLIEIDDPDLGLTTQATESNARSTNGC